MKDAYLKDIPPHHKPNIQLNDHKFKILRAHKIKLSSTIHKKTNLNAFWDWQVNDTFMLLNMCFQNFDVRLKRNLSMQWVVYGTHETLLCINVK